MVLRKPPTRRVTKKTRREDLTAIKVRCDNYGAHIAYKKGETPFMKFIGWDTAGRGYAIYACPICNWRKGYKLTEDQRIMKAFG